MLRCRQRSVCAREWSSHVADFTGLLNRLVEHEVEFVVVGGFAAVAHGCTTLTMDVDVCCRMNPENLLRLQNALNGLHPVHRMTPQRLSLALTSASCRGLKNLYLDTDWGPLDCLGTIAGLGNYEHVRDKSLSVELDSGDCRVLTLDALIEAKQAMGRPRDMDVLRQLEAIRERTEHR